MTDAQRMPAKDPDDTDTYFIIWCSLDGTNDGGSGDTGVLQGATVASDEWTVPAGITKDSNNNNSVNLRGVTYAANTLSAINLSSGTAETEYTLTCKATFSDGRVRSKSIIIPVKEL